MIENRWVALALFCALSILWMGPSGWHPTNTISDVGDPLHLAYIMSWDAHQLVRDPARLFDANSFYPWKQSLAFADHLLPEAILVAPVQWLTGNAVLAYNVAVFLGLVLSAAAMRQLILETTGNAGAALVAGVAYAFNGFTIVEANRVQVIHLQWWPLALLFLGRLVENPTFLRALALATALALQGLSGSYYLVFTALIAPVWLGLAYAGSGSRPSARTAGRVLLAALIAAVPVALVVAPYFARGLPKGRMTAGVDLLAYLSPSSDSLVWSLLLSTDPLGREFKGVIGLALIIGGLIVVTRERPGRGRALGLIAAATLGIGVILSMGDTLVVGGRAIGRGPHYWLLEAFPLEGLRHTPRFNALAVLGGAILTGLGAAAWLDRSKARAAIVGVVLAGLLPLEHWRVTGYGVRLPESAALRAAYRGLPEAPLVDLPLYPQVRKRYWAAYPYLSTYHWNPVLIGRTSFYPPGHDFLAWLLSQFPDSNSVSVLFRLGVGTVVVHPRIWPTRERQAHLEELNRLPGLVRMDRAAVPLGPNALDLGDEQYFEVVEQKEERLCVPGAEVAASALQVLPVGVDTTDVDLDLLTDRKPATRWSSGIDQSGWYRFQVRLDPPQRLAAVSIETPPDRFPRAWPNLRLRVAGGPWVSAPSSFSPEVAGEVLRGQLNGTGPLRMVVRFAPQDVEAFRLTFPTLSSPGTPNFEIEELRAFAECRP